MSDNQVSIAMPDGGRAFLDCFGCEEFVIEVNGEHIPFDWSDQFGPLPLKKDRQGRAVGEKVLGPRHQFWRAVSWWRLQGRRVENGLAIWHRPKPDIYEKRGRHLFVLQHGEPGWDW